MTSHDVVDAARRALGTRRIGHTGTLDPFATGLLALLIGRATRLMPYLVGLPKRYAGTIRLGEQTDTDDPTGRVIARSDAWRAVHDERLRQVAAAHTGRLLQRPPAFSAKKVQGTRAHRRARRGERVELGAQQVEITRLHLGARDGCDVPFAADVGGGTYLRALARDLGHALGCGAHLRALRRLAIGSWTLEAAVPASALSEGRVRISPPVEAVPHLPSRALSGAERDAVGHGRPVEAPPDVSGPLALLAEGELVAVAEPSGGLLKPRVVLAGA